MKNPIKDYLLKNKMSQGKFARELGVSTVFINHFVNERMTNIKASLVYDIHKVTGISYEAIMKYCRACYNKN